MKNRSASFICGVLLLIALLSYAFGQVIDAGRMYIGNGAWLTNIPLTNVSGMSNGSIIHTLTGTNFVLNQVYTNTSGRLQAVNVSAKLTVATIVGNASMALVVDQNGGTSFGLLQSLGEQTLITTLGIARTNGIQGFLNPGATWYLTNNSVGIGNSSAVIAGQLIQL